MNEPEIPDSAEKRAPRPFFVELEEVIQRYRDSFGLEYGKFIKFDDLVSLVHSAAEISGNQELKKMIREEEGRHTKFRSRENLAKVTKT